MYTRHEWAARAPELLWRRGSGVAQPACCTHRWIRYEFGEGLIEVMQGLHPAVRLLVRSVSTISGLLLSAPSILLVE